MNRRLRGADREHPCREDLNPIDRAQAYREFCNRFALTPEQVGQRVGRIARPSRIIYDFSICLPACSRWFAPVSYPWGMRGVSPA